MIEPHIRTVLFDGDGSKTIIVSYIVNEAENKVQIIKEEQVDLRVSPVRKIEYTVIVSNDDANRTEFYLRSDQIYCDKALDILVIDLEEGYYYIDLKHCIERELNDIELMLCEFEQYELQEEV